MARAVKKKGPDAGMGMTPAMMHPALKLRHDKNPERGFASGHGAKGHKRSRRRSR